MTSPPDTLPSTYYMESPDLHEGTWYIFFREYGALSAAGLPRLGVVLGSGGGSWAAVAGGLAAAAGWAAVVAGLAAHLVRQV